MHKQNISITAVGDAGMAFGYAADGQGVYIPKGVAAAAKVQPFGVYAATLVPNRYRPEKTELMAVHVEAHPVTLPDPEARQWPEESAVEPARDMTQAEIVAKALDLVEAGGAWTAAELIEKICGPGWRVAHPNLLAYVSSYLLKRFQDDEVSRCEVYQHCGQAKPSLVRWSVDWKDL